MYGVSLAVSVACLETGWWPGLAIWHKRKVPCSSHGVAARTDMLLRFSKCFFFQWSSSFPTQHLLLWNQNMETGWGENLCPFRQHKAFCILNLETRAQLEMRQSTTPSPASQHSFLCNASPRWSRASTIFEWLPDGLKWNTEHKTQDTIYMLKQEDAKQYANQCSRTVLVSECSRAVCPRHSWPGLYYSGLLFLHSMKVWYGAPKQPSLYFSKIQDSRRQWCLVCSLKKIKKTSSAESIQISPETSQKPKHSSRFKHKTPQHHVYADVSHPFWRS